ncbi:pentapeptide repeat-containing protein [Embleya sp. NPDC008237]|uniref:pentapeptide repeat-containing protein n=1 Tax=Embleya sp. NPDC008237 TaxID=3363978 RepID=UPI0036EC6600
MPGHALCLTHLNPTDRAAYLASLGPGADVDHCGTTLDGPLLSELLDAVRDPATTHPHLGAAKFLAARFTAPAWFKGATFSADAAFEGARFSAEAVFDGARFTAPAWFNGATFSAVAAFEGARFSAEAVFDGARFSADAVFDGATFSTDAMFLGVRFSALAWFDRARFTADAVFDGARFSALAWFDRARFTADAVFDRATFSALARFDGATFAAHVGFDGVRFTDDAHFRGVTFQAVSMLGPLACAKTLDLSSAVFGTPVVIEVAAAGVQCVRTRWDATATLRLRHSDLNLWGAIVTQPFAVTAHPAQFTTLTGDVLAEGALAAQVRVLSMSGVDAAHLVMTDTDLSECVFTGAFHLDQLRLTGRTVFATSPTGVHWRYGVPWRWTRRRVLAEEHHWRAIRTPPANPTTPTTRDWTPGPHHPDPDRTPGPDDLAPVYRELRKAFEDAKNEPGAADFYYGEMSMRRHDHHDTPQAERALITAYWALSGYGLRATRALTWLGLAMTATILAMMLWGLPTNDPKPQTQGSLSGQNITLTTVNPDPALSGPLHTRLTGKRAEKATRVVLNSVVFRSSGQNLTTAGTYIEMTSRFLEPVLLGLAALAIRSRIKR